MTAQSILNLPFSPCFRVDGELQALIFFLNDCVYSKVYLKHNDRSNCVSSATFVNFPGSSIDRQVKKDKEIQTGVQRKRIQMSANAGMPLPFAVDFHHWDLISNSRHPPADLFHFLRNNHRFGDIWFNNSQEVNEIVITTEPL